MATWLSMDEKAQGWERDSDEREERLGWAAILTVLRLTQKLGGDGILENQIPHRIHKEEKPYTYGRRG